MDWTIVTAIIIPSAGVLVSLISAVYRKRKEPTSSDIETVKTLDEMIWEIRKVNFRDFDEVKTYIDVTSQRDFPPGISPYITEKVHKIKDLLTQDSSSKFKPLLVRESMAFLSTYIKNADTRARKIAGFPTKGPFQFLQLVYGKFMAIVMCVGLSASLAELLLAVLASYLEKPKETVFLINVIGIIILAVSIGLVVIGAIILAVRKLIRKIQKHTKKTKPQDKKSKKE